MDRPTMTRRITGALLVATVLTVGIRDGAHVWAHEESLAAIESFLHGLVQGRAITEAQHKQIERLYESGLVSQLIAWLTAQETGGQISQDTHLYVNALLNLSAPDVSSAVAPADYTGNGNVRLLGHLDAQPPNPYYGDNSTTGMLYNGIWGYATGAREYALQCNSTGLHIIDVTDPLAPYRVQFINMSGGLNPPKGRIWRDVDIYTDPVSGKTYAYIGAQSNGDLWIVDLSFLSGSTAHGANSNPIPAAAIANRGRTNYGHTVSVHDGLGLLFMNTANNGSTLGCQIFDLRQDPFNPPVIASWSGSGHDCHDSFAQADVPGAGGKDLLYVADGYATRYRVVDISSVRTGGGTTLVGSSAAVSGIYAHSNWLDNDAHYLYAFEEFNARDIGVYDVSNPASPTQVTTFQYAEDATANSRIHNGQVRGKYLLTAYYEAGFRVFDISNPANPVEVGKYRDVARSGRGWHVRPDDHGRVQRCLESPRLSPLGQRAGVGHEIGDVRLSRRSHRTPRSGQRAVGGSRRHTGLSFVDARQRRNRLHRAARHDQRRTVHDDCDQCRRNRLDGHRPEQRHRVLLCRDGDQRRRRRRELEPGVEHAGAG